MLVHIPVEFRIHVPVGVELDAELRAVRPVVPQAVDIAVFEIRHQRAAVQPLPVVVDAHIRPAVGVIRIERRGPAVGVGRRTRHDGVIGEAEHLVPAGHGDDCARFEAFQRVLSLFLGDGRAALHLPAPGGQGLHEGEEAPQLVELVRPFPLEAVEGGHGQTGLRPLKMAVEPVEHGVAGIAEHGGVRHEGIDRLRLGEPRGAARFPDGVPQLLRPEAVAGEPFQRLGAHFILVVLFIPAEFLLLAPHAGGILVDAVDEFPQALVEAEEDGLGVAVFRYVPRGLRPDGPFIRQPRMDALPAGPAVRLFLPLHVAGDAAGPEGDAAVRRAGKLAHDVEHPVEHVVHDVEAEEHGAPHAEGVPEGRGNVHGALHEIEGEPADLPEKLVPHILPLLFLQIPRDDLDHAVPRTAPAGDGDDVVARHEGKIPPLEERHIPVGRRKVHFPVHRFRPGDGHHVQPVHGEAEIRRRAEAEADVLILHDAQIGGEGVILRGAVLGEPEQRALALLRAEAHLEGEPLRRCSHRVSAPAPSGEGPFWIP